MSVKRYECQASHGHFEGGFVLYSDYLSLESKYKLDYKAEVEKRKELEACMKSLHAMLMAGVEWHDWEKPIIEYKRLMEATNER